MRTIPYIFSVMAAFGIFQNAIGQEFQGKAIYQSKTNVDMDFEGREISEDIRQRIMQRMKRQMERSFELTFDRTTSLYVEEEKLDIPAPGDSGIRFAMAGGDQGEYFKDIQSRQYANQSEMFGKMFLIKDSLTSWEWKLGSDTKKIGNYTCYKATAVRVMDEGAMGRMRRVFGRGGQNNNQEQAAKDSTRQDSTHRDNNSILARIDREQEREIVAWYTPEISISQGPGPYWGLPGLILEVNDGRTVILCSKLVLHSEEKFEIKAPSKGKKVSQEEYDEILAEKMEEMQQRFQGRNRRGNSNRIMIRG